MQLILSVWSLQPSRALIICSVRYLLYKSRSTQVSNVSIATYFHLKIFLRFTILKKIINIFCTKICGLFVLAIFFGQTSPFLLAEINENIIKKVQLRKDLQILKYLYGKIAQVWIRPYCDIFLSVTSDRTPSVVAPNSR